MKNILLRFSNWTGLAKNGLESLFLMIGLILLALSIREMNESWQQLFSPIQTYSVGFTSSFEPDSDETNIYTYVPANTFRQTVLEQQTGLNDSSQIIKDTSGTKVHWSPNQHTHVTRHQSNVRTQAVQFELDPLLSLSELQYPSFVSDYLDETDVVQVQHPEIKALWNRIKPDSDNVLALVQAMHDYTYQSIETVEFKGTTDALTALRLGIASCNGKSRLFVALARQVGIPARLVGGLILETGRKRTAHQWVELFIQNQWVPFDPTNGYFASLPEHYLELYKGDHSLIRHTTNINFDYQFDIEKRLTAALFAEDQGTTFSRLLHEMKLNQSTFSVLILTPLCCLLITFLRNVLGLKTFGIFMPMLIAAALSMRPLGQGSIGFIVMMSIAVLIYMATEKLRLLKTARLAIVVTIISCLFIGLALLGGTAWRLELSIMSLFPLIIISFMAERFAHTMASGDKTTLYQEIAGTAVCIAICWAVMKSMLLLTAFVRFPELFLIVIAGLIYLGKWSGLRLSEYLRFKGILSKDSPEVMGINGRNRDIIETYNDKHLMRLATDKLASKSRLEQFNVPVPQTIAQFASAQDLAQLEQTLAPQNGFALKPNQGSQGHGIVIIKGRSTREQMWMGSGKSLWSVADFRRHIRDINAGVFSQTGDQDIAYIEPLIVQHPVLQNIAPSGLCDIRVLLAKGEPLNAMLRMPTEQSDGKANLHQGALGVAINLNTGETFSAKMKGRPIEVHPDTNEHLLGHYLPLWDEVIDVAKRCYQAIPLAYMGVDICLDAEAGVLVLEVNGRPGLEIQNVNNRGFKLAIAQSM